jgi:hypothetical protein
VLNILDSNDNSSAPNLRRIQRRSLLLQRLSGLVPRSQLLSEIEESLGPGGQVHHHLEELTLKLYCAFNRIPTTLALLPLRQCCHLSDCPYRCCLGC